MILRGAFLVSFFLFGGAGLAAAGNAPNAQPNPYRTIRDFFKLPPGRTMGSSNSVAVDHQGHIWVVDRCGANDCAGSKLDPVMEFDTHGNFIKAFGAGKFLFPHGMTIDKDDHIWVADGHVGHGIGDDVLEFDSGGKVLRILGKPGVAGAGHDTFSEPNAVLIAPNGDIFVSDGHDFGAGHNARVVKFDPTGKFILQWGGHGSGPGQFEMPHALAMDTQGRLFVADRGNNRVQIFDQNGKFIASWSQFSRPSGVFIDAHDVLYVTDSESTDKKGYGYNPQFQRGMRVGNAKTGEVAYFIPDPDMGHADPDTSAAEGVWVDPNGVIYGAEVGPKAVIRYVKK
ncbi:MAG TPA: peptidyl-alpha-hydroxyglycine alpha-amidating lyase family protein [Rhizomicrobium sp.]|jgi:DNA-binding beta-propeller fold protein YncE|nr:peptidyl-alpha-hydroxyglycine alpha-amidating lyase family protein [Rhizomicrobium sp.]